MVNQSKKGGKDTGLETCVKDSWIKEELKYEKSQAI